MATYTVWKKHCNITEESPGIAEKCLINTDGDYVNVETGILYSKDTHYHSKQYKAIITKIDKNNCTGMYHLNSFFAPNRLENHYDWKSRFIGCNVTVQEAHLWGDIKVYYVVELKEYFSANELSLMVDVEND